MTLSQTCFHFVCFNVPSGFRIICILFKSNIVMTFIFHFMIHTPSLFVARFSNKSVLVYLLHSVYTYEIHVKKLNPEREVKETVHLAHFDDSHVIVWHHFMPMGGDSEICHRQLCFG